MRKNFVNIVLIAVAILAVATSAFAQGKGRGGGAGAGRGAAPAGPASGAGVDRGLGTASEASRGRSDTGLGNASTKSKGRSDAGLARARLQRENMNNANRDLRRHPNLANDLHLNANDLRADYQAALAANPNLKFGQFVAATRLANNLGARHPDITRAAILDGFANGDSLGQTLRNLGMGKDDANLAIKRADREIKNSKRKN